MMTKPKTTTTSAPLLEKHLQEAGARILELDGWRRLRTDPVSRREWGKGFGEPGMADDLFIRYCASDSYGSQSDTRVMAEVLWVEWKRQRVSKRGFFWQKPTKAAINQRAWHLLERKRGALTLIAGEDFPATIEGFIRWYQTSGLMRHEILTDNQQLRRLKSS